MSKVVDERVVEMRFDNANFENNVRTSMSTLDKLKASLNFNGASKGLEDLNAASKKVDMSTLNNSVETVTAKFSSLQVVAVTALANITNSAVNAGKRMVSALTIDPISDGFKEYEMTLNAVQTTMAGTGESVEVVEKALKELDDYADKTVYSSADMFNNLPKFTNAGVELETATKAMIGIANATALAGGDANKASIAFYNLGQSIGTGYLTRMDYNSINNAGIATVAWKNAMVEAAIAQGTLTKVGEDSYKAGTKTYSLQQLFIDGLQQQWATADVLIDVFGDYGDANTEIGKQAWSAAQDVKTFTMMMESLKATAGTGWKDTWQLIFGGLDEAKEFWTGLNNIIGGMIEKTTEFRNKLLEGALGKSFKTLMKPLNGLKKTVNTITEPVKNITKTLGDYNKVVNEVIQGDWGNYKKRWDSLTKAGYDWVTVQNMVNEKLGYSKKRQTDFVIGQKSMSKSTEESTEANAKYIAKLTEMSDEQLESLGLNKKQIAAIKEIKVQADKLGLSVEYFVDNIDKIDGRWVLINIFKNAWTGLVKVFEAVKKAWTDIFPPKTMEERSQKLYDIIAAIHKFSTKLIMSNETASKLTRTFKGLFAIIDIIRTIAGGGLKIAFKLLSSILGAFDMDVLDLTANIGDMLVKFRDFILNNSLINKGFELLGKGVKMAVDALKEFFNAIRDLPQVKKFIENIKSVDLSEIGKNIIEGLKNGLSDGITSIPQILVNIGKSLLDAIKNVLGIHSPSTEMYDVGENTIAGLVNGIKDNASNVLEELKNLGQKCIDTIKNFDWDWGTVFGGGIGVVSVFMIKKIADTMDAISAPLNGLGSIFSSASSVISASTKSINKILKNTAKVVKSFSKVLTAKAWKIKAEAIRDLAISLAILAASVYLLAQLDAGKLWSAIGAIAVLAVVLAALAFAMSKMSDASVSIDKKGLNIKGIQSSLMQIGLAILAIAAAVKLMGSMDPDQAKQGFAGLAVIIVALGALFIVFGKFVKGKSAQNIDKAGSMIQKMAVSLLLMALVTKLVGKLSKDEMIKGAAFAGAFVIFVGALALISRVTGRRTDKLANMLLKISVAMALMVGVVKLAGSLSKDEMLKGAGFAAAFLIFVGILVKITSTNKDTEIAKISGLLLAISVSMLLMVGVVKLVGKLSPGEMIKGVIFVGAFLLFVKALVKITSVTPGTEIAKVSGTIIAMSVAIGILAAVCIVLGLIKISALAKGIIAIGMLGTIISMMIIATKGAKDVKGSIIAMAIAIGVMAASVAVLSFIKPGKLYGAVGALSILMTVFGIMAVAAGKAGKDSMMPLIAMVASIVAIAISLGVLATLPFESLMAASTGLSMVMLSLAASMAIISKLGGMDKKGIASIAVMTLVVFLLGEILGHIVKMENIESALTVAKSLSLLLLSLSVCCAILAVAGMGGPAALIGIGSLAVLVVAMGALITAIGALVTKFPQLEEFLNTGIPIMQKIGEGIGSFFGGIVKGFSSAVMQLIPELGIALSKFAVGIMPFIAVAKTIDSSVLEGIGYLALAIIALSAANLIEGITSFLSFGSSFADLGSQLTDFIRGALPFLIIMSTIDPKVVEAASTLASMILTLTAANLLSRITEFIGGDTDFSKFGEQLVSFGEALVKFSETVSDSNIDTGAVEKAASAGKIMVELEKSLPRSGGWIQSIIGEQDLAKFGSSCEAFGKAIVSFCKTVGEEGAIDTEAAQAAADAGSIMAELQNALPKTGGWIQEIAGEKDLAAFGKSCEAFGEAIVSFCKTVGAEDAINVEAAESASAAGKIMAELQNALPKTGGWWQDIAGEEDLAAFGASCKAFGESITEFSSNVNIDEDAVTKAANAGKVMASLQEAIPTDKWFDGRIDLEEFGEKIVAFGESLADYYDAIPSSDSYTTISYSTEQAEKLTDLAKKVAETNFDNVGDFGNITSIGDTLKDYYDAIPTSDCAEVIEKSTSAALNLAALVSKLANLDTSGISKFKVTSLGESINTYSTKVTGFDYESVSRSIRAMENLSGFINNISRLNTSGVGNFKTAVDTLSKVQVSKVVEQFSGAASKLSSAGSDITTAFAKGMKSKKSAITNAVNSIISSLNDGIKSKTSVIDKTGNNIATKLATGISDKKKAVSNALTTCLSEAVNAARDYYDNFYNAGSYLVSGFASGISENSYKAKAKAKAMAKAAEQAAKDELDINSPSKVFRAIGKSVPEGFAQGIERLTWMVKGSSVGMANTAVDELKSAMSHMSDIVDDDIDVQPTIRPVLDLSDVRSGAGAISGLFGTNPSIGVMANAGAISTMMNRRNQNGTTEDVISALKDLKKTINNASGDTYNLGGVTYDDGSNIADAVQTIVRAARVERRR